MALLITFTEDLSLINYENRAIYLDQKLYTLLFKNHTKMIPGSKLRKVALMTYHDDIIIERNELDDFKEEVRKFFDQNFFNHEQINDFIKVIETVIKQKLHIIVSGDMYPEHNKNRKLT